MVKVSAQKSELKNISKRDLYAQVCFYYPRYSLQEASKLPARDIKLLLRTAERIEATRMYNLVQIAASPHSKNGSGVRKLLQHFKNVRER